MNIPQTPTIRVTKILADLRGGSRATRVLADDGAQYILKLQRNPQGTFSLIAEFMGTQILANLGLPVPRLAWAKIDDSEVRAQLGSKSLLQPDDIHLAIAYPVDPDKQAIFDMLPDPSWALLTNRDCFWGALVADKWLANLDCRQAVFTRKRNLQPGAVRNLSTADQSAGMNAILIDQGLCFNGRSMDFNVAPAHGLYPNRIPYQGLSSVSQLEPWIRIARNCRLEDLCLLVDALPQVWLESNRQAQLLQLCEQLLHRAARLPRILEDTIEFIQRAQSPGVSLQ